MIKQLVQIIGLIFLIQFVVSEAAINLDSENDPIYRLFNNAEQQSCNGEECLYRNFKRSPNELVLNRDNLVTLLRHMYPKTSFTSPFLGKRAIQLKKRSIHSSS